jgi:lipopolysaccharide export LptBFGC system permease protein LptF
MPRSIFLYFFILAFFIGIVYFFYTIWIAPYFPQKRKGGRGGDRAKKSSELSKAADSADQISASGADGSTVTSAKTYDTEWIPAHHINKPEARKVKSGGSRPKTRS